MTDEKLPELGMTLDEFRALITRHAYRAQQRYGELVDRMRGLTESEAEEMRTAHHASMYGWSTVSLLGFIRNRLGKDAAFEAALMLDDMGANGDAPFTDDLPYPPVGTYAATSVQATVDFVRPEEDFGTGVAEAQTGSAQ